MTERVDVEAYAAARGVNLRDVKAGKYGKTRSDVDQFIEARNAAALASLLRLRPAAPRTVAAQDTNQRPVEFSSAASDVIYTGTVHSPSAQDDAAYRRLTQYIPRVRGDNRPAGEFWSVPPVPGSPADFERDATKWGGPTTRASVI